MVIDTIYALSLQYWVTFFTNPVTNNKGTKRFDIQQNIMHISRDPP